MQNELVWTWLPGTSWRYAGSATWQRYTGPGRVVPIEESNPITSYDAPAADDYVVDVEDPATIGCLRENACRMWGCKDLYAEMRDDGVWHVRRPGSDADIAVNASLGEVWIDACWRAIEERA